MVPQGWVMFTPPLFPGEGRTTMRGRYSKSNRGRKHSQRAGRLAGQPRRIARQALAQAEQIQLPLSVAGLVEMARDSLSRFAVEVGLKMAHCLLEDEVTQRCGQRYQRPEGRSETRYGHQAGSRRRWR